MIYLHVYYHQNGQLVGAAVEGGISPPDGIGGASAEPVEGRKPSPFNLSHLEYTLPDTEIYEAEPGTSILPNFNKCHVLDLRPEIRLSNWAISPKGCV